ncbi:hypothetical protein QBC35DRAFT_553297 [Podospora australis]|uniref:2EXR domain-containing protein n=1 Tax=Podospora australis TaxID=1536484 RepID=A0AAN6WUP2_9PEZI|nr:hypothetical protein QBC35DRAFT_553297 [Podospora australis]
MSGLQDNTTASGNEHDSMAQGTPTASPFPIMGTQSSASFMVTPFTMPSGNYPPTVQVRTSSAGSAMTTGTPMPGPSFRHLVHRNPDGILFTSYDQIATPSPPPPAAGQLPPLRPAPLDYNPYPVIGAPNSYLMAQAAPNPSYTMPASYNPVTPAGPLLPANPAPVAQMLPYTIDKPLGKLWHQLPAEVRQKIWRTAALIWSVPSVCVYKRCVREGSTEDVNDSLKELAVYQPYHPTLLLICSESHDVAIETGRVARAFDPRIDILFVNGLRRLQNLVSCDKPERSAPAFWAFTQNIRYLAITMSETKRLLYSHFNANTGALKNVQEITIIVPKNWASVNVRLDSTQPSAAATIYPPISPYMKAVPYEDIRNLMEVGVGFRQDYIYGTNVMGWVQTRMSGEQYLDQLRQKIQQGAGRGDILSEICTVEPVVQGKARFCKGRGGRRRDVQDGQ